MTFQIDAVGWGLLRRLQDDARMSFRQLGEAVGLTAPAAAERVRRLEDANIITGYHAAVNLDRLGLPIMAFVHLASNAQQSIRFREVVDHLHEVIECHTITGVETFVLKVAVPSVPHLEAFLWKMKDYGEVRTSLILSSQVTRRRIDERVVYPE